MTDNLLKNVYACENEHNLLFTHVFSQCPFTCAIKYFGEWEIFHINNIGKVLALYAPSSITLKGWLVHMGEWNKGCLFHTSCNNGFHNLIFYETFFFHFQCVHVVACNGCCQSPHQPINPTPSKVLLCQKQVNVSTHHNMIQCSLRCLGWNGAFFQHPSSIIM
jgi:hypothetical protein